MEEYIVDLTNLRELSGDDLDGDCFADHGCIYQMQNMLLNHVGKKIRVCVTVIEE